MLRNAVLALAFFVLPSAAFAQQGSPEGTPTPTASPAPSPAASPAPSPAPSPAATAAPVVTALPTPAPTPKWIETTGSLEGGATATSGNTDVQTYTGALKADAKTRNGWGLALRGSAVYAETRHVQTAGAFDTSLRGDRKILGKLGVYAKVSIDGDRFKGINNRKGAGAGLSAAETWRSARADFDHDAIRGELGYQYYRVDLALTDRDQDISAGRAFAGYAHAFTKETVFSEEAEALYDFKIQDRLLLTSTTALAVRLTKILAFKVSEQVKDDTVPDYVDPSDPTKGRFKKVDTLTSVAVIVTF